MTPLTIAGVEAMVPASPTPLTPSGFVVDGVSVRSVVKLGRSDGRGQGVVDERAVDQRALLVVVGLLEQRLRDALGEPAVHLALDQQRVHRLADVVDADVAAQRRPAGLGVDLHRGEVRAVREGEGVRVERGVGVQRRLDALRVVVRLQRRRTRSRRSPSPLSVPRTVKRPARELQVVLRRLEQVRRDRPGLGDHLLRGVHDGDAADDQRARAVGVQPLVRDLGVAVQHLDVLERDAELVRDDLAPRRLVALAVRRDADDHLDLAERQHPDGRVLPTPADVALRARATRDGASPHISVKVEMPMPSCTGSFRVAALLLLAAQAVVVEQLRRLGGGRLVVA